MSEFDSTEAVASELQRLHDAAAEAIVAHQNEKGRADKLQKRLKQHIELLAKWTHDGALQTFEDRERFRAEARQLLKQSAPYELFCSRPEQCAVTGRCMRDICCAD